MKATERHNVSVLSELYKLFKRTPGSPSIAALLNEAMRAWLIEHGVTPPSAPPPGVTSKASAARWAPKGTADK